MINVSRNIAVTQAKGCRFCLHIGSTVFYIGSCAGTGPRLELATPFYWFRYSKGVRP
jgi:hypothetical protein